MQLVHDAPLYEELRAWAHGDRHASAAVELLIEHGPWPVRLDHAGLIERWGTVAGPMARPDLTAALERMDADRDDSLYASSSELRILEIAASLIHGHKVSLTHLLQSLDKGNQRLVVNAVASALGEPPVVRA